MQRFLSTWNYYTVTVSVTDVFRKPVLFSSSLACADPYICQRVTLVIFVPITAFPVWCCCFYLNDLTHVMCATKLSHFVFSGLCDVALCGSLHVTAPNSHDDSADGPAVIGKHWSGEWNSGISSISHARTHTHSTNQMKSVLPLNSTLEAIMIMIATLCTDICELARWNLYFWLLPAVV